MNWEAISTVSEVIGAIAVVVSLIYLAVQIRQNTHMSKSATRQAIADAIARPPSDFFTDADFTRNFLRHLEGESLDTDQVLQLQAYCYVTLRTWENVHYQYRSGMLNEDEWKALQHNVKALLQVPIWRDYWERERDIYSSPFRREIDALLAELADESPVMPKSMIHPQQGK